MNLRLSRATMLLAALALPLGMAFHAPHVCLGQEKSDQELKAEQTKAAEAKAADERAAAIQKRAEQAAKLRAERAALAEKKGQQGEAVGPPGPNAAQPARPGATVPAPTVVLKPGEVPAIRFDTPIYDFGLVRAGPDIIHDFWFTNTGTGPLEILSVKPS